ncbi:MAG: hypothetical protein IT462_05255 [Planctomycetes bacterium]|nr:hypothetical protein [Planctomycetota bacterium]
MPLLVETQFDAPATLFVVALMFAPLLVAMGVSRYENRLSVYFSEQVGEPINLKKVHLIFSVIISSCVPVFAISFGLLVISKLTSNIWPPAPPGQPPEHSFEKQLVFYLFSLVVSLVGVLALKKLLFRKHLRDPDAGEARAYFLRWQFNLNVVATLLNVTIYWGAFWVALWLDPELVNKTLS